MKNILKIVFKTLALITLCSFQLCLLKYEHTTNFNVLLIAYSYIFFNNISTPISAILLIMMDGINFLMTGYFGFITIIMTIFSMLSARYETHFYNKLVIPVLSITLFSCIQNIIFYNILGYQHGFTDFLTTVLINSAILIAVWSITKRPIHT